MERKNVWGWLLLAGLPIMLGACGDDDSSSTPAGVSFEKATEEITESDGTPTSLHPEAGNYVGLSGGTGREVTVKITLDKALAADAVVGYTVEGTATSENPATNGDVNDYSIVAKGNKLTIENGIITLAKGATEASITITVYEDLDFEYDDNVLNDAKVSYETVILTLTSVVSGPVELGAQTSYTLKIDEDDAVFLLTWGVDGGDTAGDADMDMLFLSDDQIVWGMPKVGPGYEIVNFPAGFPAGSYGVAYTYYGGTSDDVDFAVGLWGTSGTLEGTHHTYPNGDPLVFDGHLGLGNINAWSEDDAANHRGDPVPVQTFTKDGLNYTSITSITVLGADASSRKAQWPELKEFAKAGKIRRGGAFLERQ